MAGKRLLEASNKRPSKRTRRSDIPTSATYTGNATTNTTEDDPSVGDDEKEEAEDEEATPEADPTNNGSTPQTAVATSTVDHNVQHRCDVLVSHIASLVLHEQRIGDEANGMRRNTFITGPAGCGKSWLIKELTARLRGMNVQVQVIAPTGIAARNVEGLTCHSFIGLTPNKQHQSLDRVVEVGQSSAVQRRLKDVQVLIIDEISMVGSQLLTQMDAIMREARDTRRVFGGVVVVAVGDFAQLPPVKSLEYCITCGDMRAEKVKDKTYHCYTCDTDVDDNDKWAFRSPVWNQLRFYNILIPNILRQDSAEFKDIIWQMFLGNRLTHSQNELLRSQTDAASGQAVRLFATRALAQAENDRRYRQLSTTQQRYTCLDWAYISKNHQRTWVQSLCNRDPGTSNLAILKDHPYASRLNLRIGMPVLLLANLNVKSGLANGSQGTIIGWHNVAIEDLPCLSDRARTSGYTMDEDMGRTMTNFVPFVSDAHVSKRQSQISRFASSDENRDLPWPVVQFGDDQAVAIYADCSVSEVYYRNEASCVTRTQIPLMPGWALTIHKAQGMTLENVVIDLSRVFEPGQEYVALSRARSLKGLEIQNFGAGLSFRTPEVVREFYAKIFPHLKAQMR